MLHTSAISPALNPLPPVRTVNIPAKIIYSTFLPRSVSLRGSRSNISLPKRCEKKRLLPGKKSSITCGAGGAVREIDESQFSEVVLKSELPVLVEFVATWCGPCRLIAPAVQSLAQEYQEKLMVVKIDHDSNPRLIEEYKVYGLPTLILFQNGQEVSESRREGAITKAKLKDYVDKLLESVSVA